MVENFERGSEWRKWDLHLHSYYTYLNNNYSGAKIEEYIQKIIDSNVKVVGLTNYFNFRNEDYLLKENLESRNIVVFMNLELRLTYLNKDQDNCDFHIIFDNKLDKEKITMFLNNLEVELNAQKCKASTLTSDNSLKNCSVEFDALIKTLEDESLGLKNKYLLGFLSRGSGNSRSSSVYEKIYEKTNLIIHSSDSDDNLTKDRDFWLKQNRPLIQTSDAHSIQKIGTKFSWIKADTTFEGLKQILQEPEERVYVGDEPPLFANVNANKTKYIDRLVIKPIDGYSNDWGRWFDNEIKFNKELVAIVGNKGSGKSAIADIIANCCDCHDQNDFSFLHDTKFREDDGKKAKNFEATLFISETPHTKKLNERDVAENQALVKYLPQGYFENICNDFRKLDNLKKEIEDVVFQYIDDADKLGTSSFNELISKKTEITNEQIDDLKGKLAQINREIIELERKENKTYLAKIDSAIKQKEEELKALEKPQEVKAPDNNSEEARQIVDKLDKLKEKQKELLLTIDGKKVNQKNVAMEIEDVKNFLGRLDNLIRDIIDFKNQNKEYLSALGLEVDEIVKFEISTKDLKTILCKKECEYTKLCNMLSTESTDDNNFINQSDNLRKQIEECEKKLEGPQKEYQLYLKKMTAYENMKKSITGDEDTPQTLAWYQKEKKYIEDTLLEDLEKKYEDRRNILRNIYRNKHSVESLYKTIKVKIDEKIARSQYLLEEYEINIDSSLCIKNDFPENILRYVKQNTKGSFKGRQEGEILLRKIIGEHSVNDENEIVSLCDEIINKLKKDCTKNHEQRFIDDQITDMQAFYDYLFSLSYVDYNYQLKLGEKKLSLLSPGEKGALLLIFYLLLDMDNKPLILDQPEDNLDNNSVARILVRFIKNAKKQRQIIMVTHNPNLAVVADAEQIIYVNIDKQNNCEVKIESGSIENPNMNKHIVDILEGAMPAFRKRDSKYIK